MDTYLESSSTRVSWNWGYNFSKGIINDNYWSLKDAPNIQTTNWVNSDQRHGQMEGWNKEAGKLYKVHLEWMHSTLLKAENEKNRKYVEAFLQQRRHLS